MKILTRILLLAALVGIGYWLWTAFFPGDEVVIRKRVDRIATLMTFDSKQGNFAHIANVEELVNLFDPEVEIVIDTEERSVPMLTGRAELRQQAFAVRKSFPSMTVKFLDLNVTLAADASKAVVNLTGEVRVAGDKELHVQELKLQLHKIEGTWFIVRVETVRTLT